MLSGRDDISAQIDAALAAGSRTVVIDGIAGSGRSSLIRAAAARAAGNGAVVIGLTGHPRDQDLALSAMVDLVSAALACRRGAGRTSAVGLLEVLRAGASLPDPLRSRLEILDLLRELASDAQVLVHVDDAHWIDSPSLATLASMSHRLTGSEISMLLSVPDGRALPGFEASPRVTATPLLDVDAADLLLRLGVPLLPVARDAVIAHASGNPLALIEMAAAAGGRSDPAELDAVTLVSDAIRQKFTGDLPQLPTATRRALLLVAAGADELVTLHAASSGPEALEALEALEPAEHVGLVRVTPTHVTFRHPLVRSSVYAGASTRERTSAHRALARVLHHDRGRATWHAARAARGPDDEVARALTEVASDERRRGRFTAAARAMQRAAQLTGDRDVREMRLLDAAELAMSAGQFEWLIQLASGVRQATAHGHRRVRAAQYIAYALAHTGHHASARAALQEVLSEAIDVDQDYGWAALVTLASLDYLHAEQPDAVRAWTERYTQRSDALKLNLIPDLIRSVELWLDAVAAPFSRPADLVAEIREAGPLDPRQPPDLVLTKDMLIGGAAWLVDETSIAAARLERGFDAMKDAGAPTHSIQMIGILGYSSFDLGRFDRSSEVGELMVELAASKNLRYTGESGRDLMARVAAVRGDVRTALRLVDEAASTLEIGHAVAVEANLRVTRAYAALSMRDHEGCYQHLRELFTHDGTPIHPHVSLRSLGDLTSAAVRLSRHDEARAIVESSSSLLASGGTRQAMWLHRSMALLAGDDAGRHYEAALRHDADAQWPFELANVRLDYGTWLRRHHQTTAARTQLRSALETFERLSARVWAEFARAELRAAGVGSSAVTPEVSAWTQLTSQERQVVRLASAGMSNREIGESLFLSPRTVSAHLYKAFPKLGVTSRSELRDIVLAAERHGG